MKLRDKQVQRLVKMVFAEWDSEQFADYKAGKNQVFEIAVQLIRAEFEKEKRIEQEVLALMDQMEKQGDSNFERYKMFPLLKKKLAAQRGVIL